METSEIAGTPDDRDFIPASEFKGLLRAIHEIEKFSESPRLVIVAATAFVELMIAELVLEHCKNSAKIKKAQTEFTLSVRVIVLHELGVISDDQRKVIDWLRKHRNDAAHEAVFAPPLEIPDWATYIEIGVKRHPYVHGYSITLKDICVNVITRIWNAHREVLKDRISTF